MRRITAIPLTLLLAVACSDTTTGPISSNETEPSFQSTDSEVQCRGFLSGVFQNVTVPRGQQCALLNSTLTGNVKVLPGATLSSSNNTIAGSIQADSAIFVVVDGDRVGGNIDIADGPGGNPGSGYEVKNATVLEGNIHVLKNQGNVHVINNILEKGNIKVEDNFNVLSMAIILNRVPMNIQVYKNTGPGGKNVSFNIAGESVQCFENQPVFTGAPNTAPKLEGQCGVPPTF